LISAVYALIFACQVAVRPHSFVEEFNQAKKIMKRLSITAALFLFAILCSFKAVTPGTWTVDKNHAKVGFSISHNMTSDVEGSFKSFDATITTPNEDFTGAIFDFSADAASVSTDNEHRDKNIRNADFLDVEKFPKMTFKSTSVTKKSVSAYQIKGNLTLHGVTKPIVLNAVVRIPPAAVGLTKTVAGFKVSGVIKRADFNIGAGFADIMLGDEITLNVNGEFAKN
jgi:polyisoprenoid-binding protein YceI